MNERMKILELLQAGTITAEQAEALLDAIQLPRANQREDKRNPLVEFKNFGSQISTAVNQSLGEVKRAIEQQVSDWAANGPGTLMVTKSIELPAGIESVSLETRNGSIQVKTWNQPFVQVQVRAQARTRDLAEAEQMLEQALQSNQTHHVFQMSIVHNPMHGVGGASLDVAVPEQFEKLFFKTQNGAIQADAVHVSELHAETSNGRIILYGVEAQGLTLESHSGSIDIQHCVTANCRSLYASTHNGTIDVTGIDSKVNCVGSAKTSGGQVEITGENIEVDYDKQDRPRTARFNRSTTTDDTTKTAHIHCESHNGSIHIHG